MRSCFRKKYEKLPGGGGGVVLSAQAESILGSYGLSGNMRVLEV